MRKFIFNVIFITSVMVCNAQAPGIYPRILNKPKPEKATNTKINGLNFNCNSMECNGNWFPIINEEFDNPFDLPNKFRFNHGYTNDDDVSQGGEFSTWYYTPYDNNGSLTNHNYEFNDGIIKLIQKPEDPQIHATPWFGSDPKDYKFSSGMLKTLSGFKSGIFEARIKVPNANKMWPSFWLLNSIAPYAEIDIFEYYDDDVSKDNCSTYNDCKMTFHSGTSASTYQRRDRYPEDIYQWHTYKTYWNEFETKFYVDGYLRGYTTRFGRSLVPDVLNCHYSSAYGFDFERNYTCIDLTLFSQLPTEYCPPSITVGSGPRPWYWPSFLAWPLIITPPCVPLPSFYAEEENDYPKNNNAMNLIVNNSMNKGYKDDNWTVFNEASTTLEIDYIKVYQPFCCNEIKTVCTLSDLHNQTHHTDILTGKKITIGTSNNSCTFVQNHPQDGAWDDIPVICLATDEIAINGDAYFPGDTYAEFRIADCNSPFRLNDSYEEDNRNDPKHEEMINQIMEDYSKTKDSIVNNYIENFTDSIINQYKPINENELDILPNPANEYVDVIISDIKFSQLVKLELVNSLGEIIPLELNKHIPLTNVKSGSYFIKFIFDKIVITKKIIKM